MRAKTKMMIGLRHVGARNRSFCSFLFNLQIGTVCAHILHARGAHTIEIPTGIIFRFFFFPEERSTAASATAKWCSVTKSLPFFLLSATHHTAHKTFSVCNRATERRVHRRRRRFVAFSL